jgi:hypothetical protein
MTARNTSDNRAVMRIPIRSLVLPLLVSVWSGVASAAPPETTRLAEARPLTGAVFVRPLFGTYRHCGGACLKSGELSWFCFAKQTCYLSCATAPPLMKCATP